MLPFPISTAPHRKGDTVHRYIRIAPLPSDTNGRFFGSKRQLVYEVIASADATVGVTSVDIAQTLNCPVEHIRPIVHLLRKRGLIDVIRDTSEITDNTPVEEAELLALIALEKALVRRVKTEGNVTPDQERSFRLYQKIKARVISNGTTPAERRTAFRMSARAIINAVYG